MSTRVRMTPLIAALVALASLGAGAPGRAAAAEPHEVVERLHAALLANMRDAAALGFEGRRERIAPVVAASFDFDAISRIVLGAHYEELDAGGRARIAALQRARSEVAYASSFDGYAGESFETLETQPGRGGRAVVRTRLLAPGEEPVSLDYVLERSPAGWRIVNVVAEGVSDLALKRAQYAAVIRSRGLPALLDELDRQIQKLVREGATSG